jgi:integrase
MILHGAIEAAVRNGIVVRNVAKLVNGKPHAAHGHAEEITEHCWTAPEAKAFLDAAKAAGDQPAAFYSLALETGMRKSELGGLKWTDIDVNTGSVKIQRQLVVRTGHPFTFGPVKNKRPRVIRVTTETNALLRRHRAHQAEIKLQSGGRYHDHGLVFAKEWGSVQRVEHSLGAPLGLNNIGQREFARLIKAAGVRRIKFHGMRHTSATLAPECGVSAKVVQERLGHQKITTTLDIYAHVLPAMDQEAAQRIGGVIHG